MADRYAVTGREGEGISLNCVVNSVGLSVLIWGAIFRAAGLW